MDEQGSLTHFVLRERGPEWDLVFSIQADQCDDCRRCGANSICRIHDKPICQCLDGFVPRLQNEWQLLIWTRGCVRRTPLDCQKGEWFVEVKNVKLPDPLEFSVNTSMTEEFEEKYEKFEDKLWRNTSIHSMIFFFFKA